MSKNKMTNKLKFTQVSRVICPKLVFITWMLLMSMEIIGLLKCELM